MTARKSPLSLLVGTRKGAFFLKSDPGRRSWAQSAPAFLGHIIQHVVQDPREPKVLLMAARTGHLGPTVLRSTDRGRTWKEASSPPAFPKAAEGQKARTLDYTFWLTPGHSSEPGVWYAGASPQALFRSDDGGDTWSSVTGLNDHPEYSQWMGAGQNGTPDGPTLHSVLVDPRDPKHLYVGMSSGGVHESTDGGATWKALVQGMEVVEGFPRDQLYVHDPHCVRLSPTNPDRLYQQNHCGIYRLDRPSDTWVRIGLTMPKKVGDIGFPMVVHPRDDRVCWVFPMDGSTVWPRVAIEGRPAAYTTRNAGRSWQRLDKGLPVKNAWWTVKRQAMCGDSRDPVGLYVGTTSGEIWASRDEGESWRCIARHLPEIYSLEVAEF
jgi:photosystem II stability/assembly factor-like uncharacterized protein